MFPAIQIFQTLVLCGLVHCNQFLTKHQTNKRNNNIKTLKKAMEGFSTWVKDNQNIISDDKGTKHSWKDGYADTL